MKKSTYSICYIPDIKTDENINYICFDNKIHIRFKDYNQEELIYGFEKKLTYLLTYLMNYSYLPNIIGKYEHNKVIQDFLKSSDIASIISSINIHCNTNIKGIKLRANYNKKKDYKVFGNLLSDYFPLMISDDIIKSGNLKSFLSILHITLDEYLFNDAFIIRLEDFNVKNINKKFINRTNKKSSKFLNNFDLEELW